uniref:Synaptopodin 2-like protein n=1 Tax=Mola mola TaxID=94237 RepID=A0A3Q4AXS9_MOLML
MVAEEVIITLSGGAPWGFRLQGGVEHQKPLQVAKVRKRSKACRAGLRESDELVSINQQPCGTLSHAQAMDLIDSSPGMLHIRVKAPAGFQSVVLVTRAPSPRIDKEYRAALRAMSPSNPRHAPVREVHNTCSSLTSCVTSPPGSEAYYGETDSDADVAGYERQRRQKRRSPSNSNPTKPTGRASPEGGETSEMSGYDSAPDAHDFPRLLDGRGGNGNGGVGLPGVARREVIYQPPGLGVWSSQTSTETSSIISSADDQGPRDGGQEEDSGLLEMVNVPLVSPERAKEAMMLSSRSQLVPMVGPLNKPIDEGLTTTYVEKAKQAMSPPPIAPKLATASVTMFSRPAPPAETPVPDFSVNNVLNRTARPFTPGFISIRAATAPVTFRPPVAKTTQRPASAAVGLTPFSTAAELTTNATSVTPPGPPPVYYSSSSVLQGPLAPTSQTPVTVHPTAISTSEEKMQLPPIPTVASMHPVCMSSLPLAPRPTTPASVALSSEIPGLDQNVATTPSTPLQGLQPEVVAPTSVPGPRGRTGILLDARRRGGKSKPMFNAPDVVKKSPNPDLLSMVQKLDDRAIQQKHGQPLSDTIYDGEEDDRSGEVRMEGALPPIAPKPKVIHETPQFLQAGGKGAELFARRQSRMGMYSMDTHKIASQSVAKPLDSSSSSSFPSKWKYSPNVRAPPPIGYNPLLTPTITMGAQRETSKPDNRGRGGSKREGIKALDFMRRQPYQLNSAMFNYGGSATNLSAMPSYQAQRQQHVDYTTTMVGSSLTPPKQIPIKTARVYEVKRFSTPTPMSAPTLIPKVIAPRSATTLGERLTHSDMNSPPPSPSTPTPGPFVKEAALNATTTASPSFQTAGLPSLPKLFSTSIPNPVPHAVPTPYTPISFSTGLQSAKQFQSAPELCVLASLPPLKSNLIQAPKPRFVATKGGIQPRVW